MKMAVDFDNNKSFEPSLSQQRCTHPRRHKSPSSSPNLRHLRTILANSLTCLRRSGAVIVSDRDV